MRGRAAANVAHTNKQNGVFRGHSDATPADGLSADATSVAAEIGRMNAMLYSGRASSQS